MFDARANIPMSGYVGPKKVNNAHFTFRPFFMGRQTHHKTLSLSKGLTIPLALLFLFNALGCDILVSEVWAASSPSGLTSVGLDNTGSPKPLKELNPDTFTIPQELGYIKDAVKIPNSGKTVIHIQDAHCNYAAQRQIADILNYLTKEYGAYAVNCEGGAGSYDLSAFTSIPEKDIRERTSDYFVKEGVVNAAEFFAVNNPEKVKLWGIENPDLYIKNLKIYRDSLSHKDEADKYIKSIAYVLNNLKRHIYPEGLLEFDSNYTRYKDNKMAFKEYITYMLLTAKKRMIDIKSFQDIYLLAQTLGEEDKINFKKANNERDEVVERLKKVLSKTELSQLMEKVGQMKIERISQADFYSYFTKKAKSINLDLTGYPELQKYIVYISLYGAIDRTKIAKEIEVLEDRIAESFYENDAQRELGILSKNLVLTGNMLNISLTKDDYTYYEEHRAAFAVSNYTKFIDKKAPLYRILARPDKNIERLDGYRENMEQFYQCSLERDKAFVKNIKFTDHDRPNSIIITGGFHSENLRELFKNEKVSYISIMPKFKNEKGYESPYLKRLAGQRTALENVIDTAIPAVLNLAVVNILSTELAMKVEGKAPLARFRLAVQILAALDRISPLNVKVADKGKLIKGTNDDGEKFITFTKAEGADAGNITGSSSVVPTGEINAVLTVTGTEEAPEFDLSLSKTPVEPAQLPPAQMPPESSQTTALLPPIAPDTVMGKEPVLEKTQAELLYESAVKPAVGVASRIRKNTATRMVSLVTSEADKALVGNLGQMARDLVGPGTDIHLSSYVDDADKDVWMPKLKELLEIELKNFVENDLSKRAPLMEIRIKDGKDTRRDVEQMIESILTKLGYQERIKDIRSRIRLVQIYIEPGAQTNPAIEFFADMGMLECDRYINRDSGYEEALPPDLQNSFLALLKLSIKNGTDFDGKDIGQILNMIFAGHLLEIKPADFRSFDERNRANRQLMQSV